jgi:DNA-binding HxlR family transcriptional regulator
MAKKSLAPITNDKHLDDALRTLIARGLVKEEMINGEPHYSMTDLGKATMNHEGSDIKTRN